MNYFLSLLIVLAPAFSNYVLFGPISIGDFLVFTAVLLLVKYFKINVVNVGALIVSGCIIFIGFFVLYDHGIDPGFFRMAFYYTLFFFVISLSKINFKSFFSVYIYCAVFFSASLIFQWVGYKFLNISIPLQLPIPYYEADTLKVIDDSFRSGGWFKEPSYFAIFIMPAFFYLLYNKFYFKYFFVVFAGIVSTSSLAIFAFLLSVLLLFVKTKRGWLRLACVMPAFVAMAYSVLHFFSEWTFVSRFADIFIDGGTLNERVEPVLDIVRLSLSFTPNPAAQHLVVTAGDSGSVWYSSAAYILASLGWLGVVFLLFNLIRFGAAIGIIIFTLFLTAHIFSGAYSFFIAFAFLGIRCELIKFKREVVDLYREQSSKSPELTSAI